MKKIFLILLFFLFSCTKERTCFDCKVSTLVLWYMLPEHDTLIYYPDTLKNICNINPREFEKENTGTTVIYYIDNQGRITRLYGYEFKTTNCN